MAFSYDAFHWKPLSNDALPDPGPWVDPRDRSIWAPDVIKNVSLLLSCNSTLLQLYSFFFAFFSKHH